ncbi:Protein translocase subunit SecD [Phycisphaerales bacterium]|nr:Protein translocase subunit SecD [Phycisphaerales bacterium]
MRHIWRNLSFVLAAVVLAAWCVYPPDKTLRRGKDLAGGVSMVYHVSIGPNENAKDVLDRTIDVLKQRVDPNGLMEIEMVQQGNDRIEIAMPLPSPRAKALQKDFEDAMTRLREAELDESRIDMLVKGDATSRAAALDTLSAGSDARREMIKKTIDTYDAFVAARGAYDTESDPDKKKAMEPGVAAADIAYEQARAAAIRGSITEAEIRGVVNASTKVRTVHDRTESVTLPTPREVALKRVQDAHPESRAEIDRLIDLYVKYEKERTSLDDPQDLIRMLKGAGVLTFRITVKPGSYAGEDRAREELRLRGPANITAKDVKWCKVNDIQAWIDSPAEARAFGEDPEYGIRFFNSRGYIAAPYGGDYYILCHDTRTARLTQEEGSWQVARAYPGADSYGRPAIHFQMNANGAVLLGSLTRAHVGDQMGVLLDDQIYTAPTLQSAISSNGQITGSFSDEEIRYVVRVLSGGSLQAKLSPEPISVNSVGPELGIDNLRKGLAAGLVSIVIVAGFMVVYYFSSGVISVIALLVNSLLILGAMALSEAAFTMPGIAGVILTFGQAVDSNVLIYERMREEFHHGADMKTAVRVGFARALSPIMDGNVANLIICVVLYYFGTQEIRGFAITLGIGVLTTLFSALVVSRVIFDILVEKIGWRKTSQLPMTFPFVQRLMTPHVDWMKYRHVLLGALVIFLAASGVVIVQRGSRMLGTEFRGGSEVEFQFKKDPTTGNDLTLKREEVHERLKEIAESAPANDPVSVLAQAEVLPVNPRSDGVTSNRFRIRTGPADEKIILDAIANRFQDVIEGSGGLAFGGAGTPDWRGRVFQILSHSLGENIERPSIKDEVGSYMGGAAIVLENLDPPPTRESLWSRLQRMRLQHEYADTLARARELRVIDGNDAAVKSAVILVKDEMINAYDSTERWESRLAVTEWRLVNDALTRPTQLASVQTFSPTVAATFATQAILTVVISLFLLTVYVWIRFGSPRWAIAATVPLFADVVGIAGMIGLAEVLYESPVTGNTARALGLLPFKFDLAQIAALLTIVGYSLNDKIIILDRIRENKGKLPFATYQIVNDSINQTLSRTLITAGGHLITTVILYVFGGEAVRGFAFAFNLGVVLGTYTSIVSSPLVWSRKYDNVMPPGSTPTGIVPAAV